MIHSFAHRRVVQTAGLFVPMILVGCAPRTFPQVLDAAIRGNHVRNAAARIVRDMPWFRADSFVQDQLHQAETATNVEDARRPMKSAAYEGLRLAIRGAESEIQCLTSAEATGVWRRCFPDEPLPESVQHALFGRFAQDSGAQYRRFIQTVESAETPGELRKLARSVLRRIGSSPKDRKGGGPLLALVAASIKEVQEPFDSEHRSFDLYAYDASASFEESADPFESAAEYRLLQQFAPLIAQERNPGASYPHDVDQIGKVRLTGSRKRPEVLIDTTAPTVYAYSQRAIVGDREYTQLVYTWWYPAHPARAGGTDPSCNCSTGWRLGPDPEAGRIDGGIVRITLDSRNRPAVFETMLNCGCHHRVFTTAAVEAEACRAFGSPMPGKGLCVERDVPRKMDLVAGPTVESPERSESIILVTRARAHLVAAIRFDPESLRPSQVGRRTAYALRPYEDLEKVPLDDGFASMFQTNGLVRGAARPEGWMMAMTGMLSAGQPRQRGTQRIRWDQYDFDDPRLLQNGLRLPPDF